MGMLATLSAKTVNRAHYNRNVHELAATIVGEARVRLKDEGRATPTGSEVKRRATLLYLEGARAFHHGMFKRMDFLEAINRLTDSTLSSRVSSDERAALLTDAGLPLRFAE